MQLLNLEESFQKKPNVRVGANKKSVGIILHRPVFLFYPENNNSRDNKIMKDLLNPLYLHNNWHQTNNIIRTYRGVLLFRGSHPLSSIIRNNNSPPISDWRSRISDLRIPSRSRTLFTFWGDLGGEVSRLVKIHTNLSRTHFDFSRAHFDRFPRVPLIFWFSFRWSKKCREVFSFRTDFPVTAVSPSVE